LIYITFVLEKVISDRQDSLTETFYQFLKLIFEVVLLICLHLSWNLMWWWKFVFIYCTHLILLITKQD